MSVMSANTSPAVRSDTAITAGSAMRFFSLRRTTSLVLALLVVVAGIAAYGICGVVRGIPLRDQYVAWSACGMLVFLAIAILLIGRNMTLRSLHIVEQQLQALTQNQELTVLESPVPDDLRPIMTALSIWVSFMEAAITRLGVDG